MYGDIYQFWAGIITSQFLIVSVSWVSIASGQIFQKKSHISLAKLVTQLAQIPEDLCELNMSLEFKAGAPFVHREFGFPFPMFVGPPKLVVELSEITSFWQLIVLLSERSLVSQTEADWSRFFSD